MVAELKLPWVRVIPCQYNWQTGSAVLSPVFLAMKTRNPSPDDVNDYAAALEAAGVVHEFHRYDDAGHAFQNFPTPEHYRETQSEDAWAKVLTFLDGLLK